MFARKHFTHTTVLSCCRQVSRDMHHTLAHSSYGPLAHTSFLCNHIVTRSFAKHVPFRKPPAKSDKVLCNNSITFPDMRVVFNDDKTGKSEWKIMKRGSALAFARSKALDLVLVKPPTNDEVAVCVLQDFKKKQMEAEKKVKAEPKKKAKPIKQIRVGALCDTHDLDTKLNKVKGFLSEGLQVRVSIFAKKRTAREHPLALDETTLRVLDGLEQVAGPVQSVSKESSRVEFIISPLKK
mmetsp:Transcript_17848/g.29837  ORF Transcript_17848/g.29837 Transcript_17848/m.29837 type:complete len:238 (+) Transcript_17848:76-789(+)